MVEASVQGFLRTILILILVYYALKWLGRILFPVLFQKAMKKEGETVIDRRPKPQRESNKNVGEYVDYEEID
jgi:hypothetical protein